MDIDTDIVGALRGARHGSDREKFTGEYDRHRCQNRQNCQSSSQSRGDRAGHEQRV